METVEIPLFGSQKDETRSFEFPGGKWISPIYPKNVGQPRIARRLDSRFARGQERGGGGGGVGGKKRFIAPVNWRAEETLSRRRSRADKFYSVSRHEDALLPRLIDVHERCTTSLVSSTSKNSPRFMACTMPLSLSLSPSCVVCTSERAWLTSVLTRACDMQENLSLSFCVYIFSILAVSSRFLGMLRNRGQITLDFDKLNRLERSIVTMRRDELRRRLLFASVIKR